MLQRAGRLEDLPDCPDAPVGEGPAAQLTEGAADGSEDVLINGKKALRMGDQGKAHEPDCTRRDTLYLAFQGSSGVLINRRLAHRAGDEILHVGGLVPLRQGSGNVLIGGEGGRVPALSMHLSSCPIGTCPRGGTAPFCRNYPIPRRRLQQAFKFTCSANVIMAVLGRHDNSGRLARGDDERLYFDRFWHMNKDRALDRDSIAPIMREESEFRDAAPEGYSGDNIDLLGGNLPEFLTALTGLPYAQIDLEHGAPFDGAHMVSYASRAPAAVGLRGFKHWMTMLGAQGPGVVVHDSWTGTQRFIHQDCIPADDAAAVPWNTHFQWNTLAWTGAVVTVDPKDDE